MSKCFPDHMSLSLCTVISFIDLSYSDWVKMNSQGSLNLHFIVKNAKHLLKYFPHPCVLSFENTLLGFVSHFKIICSPDVQLLVLHTFRH